jgi:hypothetical protein
MESSITVDEASHCAIVEAIGPLNMLGAPIQAENEPRLIFLASPGPENSPNGVQNGPLSALVASITPEGKIQQPTDAISTS